MPSWLSVIQLCTCCILPGFNRVIFLLSVLHLAVVTLLSCFPIRIFCYVSSFPLFAPSFLFPRHPVVHMVLCILFLLACWHFFRFFFNIVLFYLDFFLSCLDIFLVLFLSPDSSGLFSRVVFFALLVFLLFSVCPNMFQSSFFCIIIFDCSRRFLICVSSQISHPGFYFQFMILKGAPILSLTIFSSALISSFDFIMLLVELYVGNCFFGFFFCFCLDWCPSLDS